ncbi:MAG: hypothetical protein JXA09_05910 [Anaerolineae bacterium]|nr:hypothetical protein [Anaerolineae bacterium]
MAEAACAVREALTGVARVASAILDGDEARRIITPRAMAHIAHPDPEYRFLAGDYYDVDHETFLRTKKMLLRLARLLDYPCGTALWVPVAGLDGAMTLAVQNGAIHRYYRFGALRIETPPEMCACMDSGEIVVAPMEHGCTTWTVLAPVFDSLGDVAAVAEFSALDPSGDALAPAWS